MGKTILSNANAVARFLPLLLAATTAACVGVDTSAYEAPASNIDIESTRLEGDGDDFGPSRIAAPEMLDNSAPCGDRTLAVVHARSGAAYVFCDMGHGRTGVLEELPADGSAASVLDSYVTPAEVLRAVAPTDVALPEDLVAAVERGASIAEYRPLRPITLGVPKAPSPMTMAQSYYCANPQEFGYAYGWSASFLPFVEEFVADHQQCSLHLWNTSGVPSVTWHQRTASTNPVYEDYGPPYATACGAKEHVLSCDGSTLFEALRKETPESSWTTALSYWVSNGAVATWKMYASDCRATSDRDDMRYTGNSEPGAYHHYTTIFIKWLGGGFCDFN